MMFLRSRACVICGQATKKRRRLEIYQTETSAWRKRKWPVCSYCASRLALAAHHGSVLHARNGGLIVDLDNSAGSGGGTANGPRSNSEIASALPSPVVAAISLMSVLVIMAFGALATFGSPVYFLGAIVPFAPLGFVAWRAGDHSRGQHDSLDDR